MKREVYRCDFLQILAHFYSEVLLIGSSNFNFSSQYVSFVGTLCNTSNIMYYTAILCHKLVSLVLLQLIAIKYFNAAPEGNLLELLLLLFYCYWHICWCVDSDESESLAAHIAELQSKCNTLKEGNDY